MVPIILLCVSWFVLVKSNSVKLYSKESVIKLKVSLLVLVKSFCCQIIFNTSSYSVIHFSTGVG